MGKIRGLLDGKSRRRPRKKEGATENFLIKKEFLRKFCKKPLAVFLSWGIFLPVAGNNRDDNNRRPPSSGKSKAKTKIKIFQKSS
jgi:hypothetical protein